VGAENTVRGGDLVGAEKSSGHAEQTFRATSSDRSRCRASAPSSLSPDETSELLKPRILRNGSIPGPPIGRSREVLERPSNRAIRDDRAVPEIHHAMTGRPAKDAGHGPGRVFGTHRQDRACRHLGRSLPNKCSAEGHERRLQVTSHGWSSLGPYGSAQELGSRAAKRWLSARPGLSGREQHAYERRAERGEQSECREDAADRGSTPRK
jgi:hypothetical protein